MNQQSTLTPIERGMRLLSCALFEFHLTHKLSPFMAMALGRQGVNDFESLYHDLMREAAEAVKH